SYTLPTASERLGDFSQSLFSDGNLRMIYDPLSSRIVNNRVVRDAFAGNKIPSQRFDRVAPLMLSNLWDPNNPGDIPSGLNNYRYDETRPYKYYNLSNRVDWNISDRWRAYGRVS